MSKFEEICLAYSQARRTFNEYEETCRDFARELVFGMVDYLEWPQDQEITYIPLGEEFDPSNRFYALAGAMRMGDESFWHFGVELAVTRSMTASSSRSTAEITVGETPSGTLSS